ncbi:hypothetical protein RRG08_020203 [Elysia crispata]|uniref:Uncharacterized protein n=1 Tax=Elysia crispata TaxID=231223 RepID=A0AAE1A210_9GAST|nr:hypothetical protein RRG08_020203 [Elysia crispata]
MRISRETAPPLYPGQSDTFRTPELNRIMSGEGLQKKIAVGGEVCELCKIAHRLASSPEALRYIRVRFLRRTREACGPKDAEELRGFMTSGQILLNFKMQGGRVPRETPSRKPSSSEPIKVQERTELGATVNWKYLTWRPAVITETLSPVVFVSGSARRQPVVGDRLNQLCSSGSPVWPGLLGLVLTPCVSRSPLRPDVGHLRFQMGP